MVKKTCRNRFTALMSTAKRNSHASPDIATERLASQRLFTELESGGLLRREVVGQTERLLKQTGSAELIWILYPRNAGESAGKRMRSTVTEAIALLRGRKNRFRREVGSDRRRLRCKARRGSLDSLSNLESCSRRTLRRLRGGCG